MARTIYGLRQSPWTERACWALDHHRIAYTYHEHVPLIGELFLRRKARRKKASVPLFADGDVVVMGSFEIAKHAESVGRGAQPPGADVAAALFPTDRTSEVAHWVDVAERLTGVGRALLLRRLATDRSARAELLPSFVPRALRGALAPTSGMALRFIAKKWAVPADVEAQVEQTLRPLLEEVTAALRGRPYLVSDFTYADIAVASSMQLLRARPDPRIPQAVRDAWGNEALAREFEELLTWRDAVYDRHRAPPH